MIDERSAALERASLDIRRDVARLVAHEDQRIEHLSARLATLGPAQTLARGYAVVQRVPGSASTNTPDDHPHVVASVHDMPIGTQLRVRVADGATRAAVMGVEK
jgi:exodeoxyribonuclease VII large subunit